MIETTCDYCFRQFGYEQGQPAICLNCGNENVRTKPTPMNVPLERIRQDIPQETAMRVGALERAVRPKPTVRPPISETPPRRRRKG